MGLRSWIERRRRERRARALLDKTLREPERLRGTSLKPRHAARCVVREVREGGRPITITQNGEAKVVLMDVENYDRWRASMALLKLLAQGESDVERGRTVKQVDAFRRARKQIARSGRDA